MKASTQSTVAGIGYCLLFYLINWLAFAIPYECNFEYAIFLPMILGLCGIPVYFIVRNHFDESVRRYRLSYWIALTICSIAVFTIFATIGRFDSWEGFGYSLAFFLIGVSVLAPLLMDFIILACKAFWNWLGNHPLV